MAFQQEQIPVEDEMMVDETDEIDAMLAAYQEQQPSSQRAPSLTLTDDEYEDLFAELVQREQSQGLSQFSQDRMDISQSDQMQS